jgi:peptide/nickel transport system substrate-binding protein
MRSQSSKCVLLCVLTALFVVGFSVSCIRKSQSSEPIDNSVLRIATSFKIQSVDPIKSGHYFLVEYGVVELPLIRDESNQITPWLLESYSQVDDLNWRLTLRPNVQFQNGKPLTAAKLAAAMNRQLARSAATRAMLSGAKVVVSSDNEVLLTTLRPDPTVPAALADETVFPVYDVEAIESAGNDEGELLNCRCYTGPYRLVTLDDREMKLEVNDKYWRGTPPLKGVLVRFVPDPQARILAVQNGEIDVALYPPTEAKRMLENRSDAFFVVNDGSSGGPCLVFNVRRPPFDETAVRRAFSLGLNYEALARNVMDGVYGTATGFYPPSFSWAIQNQKTDLAEARRLLTDAGWSIGEGGVRSRHGKSLNAVLIVYPQQPDWITLATVLQGQMSELGFHLSIQQVDDIDSAMKNSTNWNVAIDSPGVVTTGGAPDPILSDYLRADAEQNYGGVADNELNKLIGELGHTFAASRREELLKRIQEIVIVEKAYQIRPLFSHSRAVVGPWYRNYKPSLALHHVTYETKPG